MTAGATLEPGSAFADDFTLTRPLGRGGMGVVHRARDPNGVAVALKSVRAAPGPSVAQKKPML